MVNMLARKIQLRFPRCKYLFIRWECWSAVGGGEVWAGVRSYSSKKEEERQRTVG